MLIKVVRSFFPAAIALAILFCVAQQLSLRAQQQHSQTISAPFILDHNRVFVDLDLVKSDGGIRKVRAFVDMGDQHLAFSESVAKELLLDRLAGADLRIRVAGAPLVFDRNKINFGTIPGDSIMGSGEPRIESNFPATILMNYDVVFDYGARTITLAASGSIPHEGIRIPCRVNPQTGLVSVNMNVANVNAADIGPRPYAVTIDNGGAYTWIAKAVVQDWVASHPAWLIGVGAIGNANMNGREEEASALLARVALISLDSLQLRSVGLAGYAMQLKPSNQDIFDWYSQKAPEKVVGFIGGNVLKSFRIEIDYAHHETYWSPQSPLDAADMDQVPLVIRPEPDGYAVIGVFTHNGKKQVDGVEPGDKLLRVGSLATKGATFGTVLDALHGSPGAARTLVLDRNGHQFTLTAHIPRF